MLWLFHFKSIESTECSSFASKDLMRIPPNLRIFCADIAIEMPLPFATHLVGIAIEFKQLLAGLAATLEVDFLRRPAASLSGNGSRCGDSLALQLQLGEGIAARHRLRGLVATHAEEAAQDAAAAAGRRLTSGGRSPGGSNSGSGFGCIVVGAAGGYGH